MRAWAALRPASVESRFEALHASGLTELVGREEELELLLRRWSKAKTGEGQVVLLSGEAGIGKSRLTAALAWKALAASRTLVCATSAPRSTPTAPLYPIISQMERAAGLAHDDTPQAKLDKLDAVLAQTSTRRRCGIVCRDAVAAERWTLSRARPDPGTAQAKNAGSAHRSNCEALSRQKPVLMIFEDAHWTDPTSLEAFGRAVDRIATLPRAADRDVPPRVRRRRGSDGLT